MTRHQHPYPEADWQRPPPRIKRSALVSAVAGVILVTGVVLAVLK